MAEEDKQHSKENPGKPEDSTEKITGGSSEKYIIIIVGIIIFIVLAAGAYIFLNYEPAKFKYDDIYFNKTYEQNTANYMTLVGILDKNRKVLAYLMVKFMNSPKTLANIGNFDGNMTFYFNDTVYISIEDPVAKCSNNVLADYNLASFIKRMGANPIGATANESSVKEDVPYIDCRNASEDVKIILIGSKNETKITKLGENCYELGFKGCEMPRVTEKFELDLIEGYIDKGILAPMKF